MHFSWFYHRMLQCKLNGFLISTVCYQGFLNFWIQQLVTEVKYYQGSFVSSWSRLTHSSILQVHARLNSFQEAEAWGRLRHRWNRIVRWTHLSKNFIQPLEGAVQVDLNPAGGASNILAVVLCSPALEDTLEVINLLNTVVKLLSKKNSHNQKRWLKTRMLSVRQMLVCTNTPPHTHTHPHNLEGHFRGWVCSRLPKVPPHIPG